MCLLVTRNPPRKQSLKLFTDGTSLSCYCTTVDVTSFRRAAYLAFINTKRLFRFKQEFKQHQHPIFEIGTILFFKSRNYKSRAKQLIYVSCEFLSSRQIFVLDSTNLFVLLKHTSMTFYNCNKVIYRSY